MYDYSLGLYEKATPDNMPLEEKMLLAKRTGYDHMELCVDLDPQREQRLLWNKDERKYWHNFSLDNDMPFKTFSLSLLRKYPLGICDDAANKKSFEIIEKGAKLACDLGSGVMLVNGYDVYSEPSTPETVGRFYENLPKAVAICEKYGIILAIENAEKDFCDSVSKATRIVRYINSPYFKVYADCGNTANFALGDADKAVMDLVSGRGEIAAMHLKDTHIGEYRFTRYGQGHVDFEKTAKAVKEMSIRCFTAELFYSTDFECEAEALRVNKLLRYYLDK